MNNILKQVKHRIWHTTGTKACYNVIPETKEDIIDQVCDQIPVGDLFIDLIKNHIYQKMLREK